MSAVAKRIRIHGRVQGVAYRAWTVETAEALGVRGWVRNRSDGTVEALLVGQVSVVQAMIEACRDGPPAARVARIDVEDDVPPPDAGGFRHVPTV
ncbi:MAG TPA: acylphosphatase [Candidatus Cybelea sp.]|nr:acylphosphatase [Candidatus Cybelea sp.]